MKTVDATSQKHFECDIKITLRCLYIFHDAVFSTTDHYISYSNGMKKQAFKRMGFCYADFSVSS